MDRGWIDELISKLNIVDVISKYVPLKKKGRTHWGCCPFHHEKDPSFAVNEDKQFYHCFGCKESGNVITFIEKIESVDFWDAVKILAKEAHFTLPESAAARRDTAGGISREKRDRLLALMRAAGRHYYENLQTKQAEPAIEYMKMRGIDRALARKFALGYSIDGQEIIGYLTSAGYTKEEIKEAGIAETGPTGLYDVFARRLIIPIVNHLGEAVAFGGRLLNASTHIAVKYRNSSNTPIFDKSRTLFALNLVKRKKQRENVNYIIVCEGYMDVMMLHKAGFDTAVASMGTSLTFRQAKLLRNYTENVYISYDGDSAGQAATLRGLDILRDAGLNVKVITLPDGMDPDDLIKSRGREAYEKLISEALTLTEYKLESIVKKYDLSSPDGKAAYAIEAMKIIGALKSPVEQEEYIRVVIKNTGYEKQTLLKQLGLSGDGQNREEEERVPDAEAAAKAPRDKNALFVVASLVHNKDYADIGADIYPYLKDEYLRTAYEYVVSCVKKGEKSNPSSLFTLLGDEEDALSLADYGFVEGDGVSKYAACVGALQAEYLTAEKNRLAHEYEKDKNVDCLKQIMQIDRRLQRIRNKGGNA